jgi:hypothetical protein
MITEQFVNDIIGHYSKELMDNAKRHPIALTRAWASTFPHVAGIYAIFLENEIVYIGETGMISARLRDLLDSRNHTLRRNMGKSFFSDKEGYQNASTSKKFPPHIETMVNDILEKMTVAVLPVALGRAETEEYLVAKYHPVFNSKSKRK